MNRYHVKTGFFPGHIEIIKTITDKLNTKAWRYSGHCLDNIKYRIIDIKAMLLFIKNLKLNYGQVFEYYSVDDNIIKLCYRITWKPGLDLILVISQDKNIITIYLNSENDKHDTLKKELYNKI